MKIQKFTVQITSADNTRWFHSPEEIAHRIQARISGMANAMTEGSIPEVIVAPEALPLDGEPHPDNCPCRFCGK